MRVVHRYTCGLTLAISMSMCIIFVTTLNCAKRNTKKKNPQKTKKKGRRKPNFSMLKETATMCLKFHSWESGNVFSLQHSDSNCNLKKRMNSTTSQMDQSPEASIISNSASQSQPISIPPPALGGTSKIDQYSRILFPVAFAGFNLVYWVVYLSKDTMEVSTSV